MYYKLRQQKKFHISNIYSELSGYYSNNIIQNRIFIKGTFILMSQNALYDLAFWNESFSNNIN